jgi:hypothetical protein
MSHFATRYKPGQLYAMVDFSGNQMGGMCLLLELNEPGTYTLQEVVRPNHWHFKVLRDGKIELHDTSITSLIDLPPELVN